VLKPPISSECPWKSIDTRWITPGVSMLFVFSHCIPRTTTWRTRGLRLTLELLHDIQKLVVYFWSLPEPALDEIQVGEGVSDVERSSCAVRYCWRCRGRRQHGQPRILDGTLCVHDRVKGRRGMATGETSRSKSRDVCVTLFPIGRNPDRISPIRNDFDRLFSSR